MKRVGSRLQVMRGTAKQTGGGLRKRDLKYNKHGKIVSKKVSTIAKKNLKKGGYKIKNMIGGGEYDIFYQLNAKSKWVNGKLKIIFNGPILDEEYSILIGDYHIYFHNTNLIMNPPRKKFGMSRNYRVNIIDTSKSKIIKIAFNNDTTKQAFINEFMDTLNSIKKLHNYYNTANAERRAAAADNDARRAAQIEQNRIYAERLHANPDANADPRAAASARAAAPRASARAAARAAAPRAAQIEQNRIFAETLNAYKADTADVTANNSGIRSTEKAMASTLQYSKATKHLRSESYLPNGAYVYLFNKQSYGNLFEYKPYGNDDPQSRFIRDVRADGSCFFRAIILGLLELCWDKEAFLRTIIEKINEISKKDQYNQRVNYELLLRFLNKFVLNYINTHEFVEYSNIICTELNKNIDEIMSKHFILFIKLLVVNCNKPIYLQQKNILTSVKFDNIHFANQIIDHYFDPTTFNTQTDIIAIREEFTININVYQYNRAERDPNRRTYKSANSSYNNDIKPTISLFYTEHHYMMFYDNRTVTALRNAATARPAYSSREEELISERRRQREEMRMKKYKQILNQAKITFKDTDITNEDIKNALSSIPNMAFSFNNKNKLMKSVTEKLFENHQARASSNAASASSTRNSLFDRQFDSI